MPFRILDATARAAWLASTSQRGQLEALTDAFATVPTVRYYAGGTLLRTQTLPALSITNSVEPYKITLGLFTADTHAATGTPTRMTLCDGTTEIVEMSCSVGGSSDVDFVGAFKALCAPRINTVTLTPDSALLPRGGFDSVSYLGTDAGEPHTTSDQIFILQLHASGGASTTTGKRYSAVCSDLLADPDDSAFLFSTGRGTAVGGVNVTLLRPVDSYGLYPSLVRRESAWVGFMPTSGQPLELITEARLDALIAWSDANVENCSPTKRYAIGGSMGAWGCMTYAMRRPAEFAAVYADRPRVRSNATSGSVTLMEWTTGSVNYNPSSTAPNIAARWGSGSAGDYFDLVAYVADTNNVIPWLGWNIGSADGFSVFSDHIAMVEAMQTARRGFAFAWNDGNHSTGSIPAQITDSYPYGLFQLGVGYPRFENHSLDDDPSVDAVGGINLGLTFRSVSESAGSWSCEVTSITGACTVDVSPISSVFTGDDTPQTVTITAANSWQTVTFT